MTITGPAEQNSLLFLLPMHNRPSEGGSHPPDSETAPDPLAQPPSPPEAHESPETGTGFAPVRADVERLLGDFFDSLQGRIPQEIEEVIARRRSESQREGISFEERFAARQRLAAAEYLPKMIGSLRSEAEEWLDQFTSRIQWTAAFLEQERQNAADLLGEKNPER